MTGKGSSAAAAASLGALAFRLAFGLPLFRRRGDAGFFRDGTREPGLLSPSADPKTEWAYWKRAAVFWLVAGLALGWWRWRAGTEWVLGIAAGTAAGALAVWAAWTVRMWEHHREKEFPLHVALAPVLGIPLTTRPREWLEIPVDYATNTEAEVVIYPPGDFTGSDADRQAVTRTVTAKLPEIEAPDAQWNLGGREPHIIFTHSQPPPALVTWENVAEHVKGASASELVIGIGKRDQLITRSLKSDSPHLLISMGSGGGKSNLAAFLLVQALMRGWIALILDAKYMSHPWAYKDMDAEYGLLPNIGYVRRTDQLHAAMAWLGKEFEQRTQEADKVINAKGDFLGPIGSPLLIIAEEMNMASDRLKAYWADTREKGDPRKSPAFTGFNAVSCGGRGVGMHLVTIAQQGRSDVVGGGAARENMGLRFLARYTANSWKMLAGDLPMPPSPEVDGRIQCVAGASVAEVQVPLMDFEQVRELAMSGTVTSCPAGMPGTSADPSPVLGTAPSSAAPDQGFVLGLTLSEAIRDGVLDMTIEAARKAVQRAGLEHVDVRRNGAFVYALKDLHALRARKARV